jgi:hypothetical protein
MLLWVLFVRSGFRGIVEESLDLAKTRPPPKPPNKVSPEKRESLIIYISSSSKR